MSDELGLARVIRSNRINSVKERNKHTSILYKDVVLSSVSDPDQFGFVSFWLAGSGFASMKRIRIRVAKNQPKSWKSSTKINKNH